MTLPRVPRPRFVAAAAAASLLGSCAQPQPDLFTPDPAAKAPVLEGFGRSDMAVTTRNAEARRLFNAGVLQAYAFNEREAVRMFKAALAQDPACAMCAWGVAWQLGPTINDHGREDVPEALKYVGHALRHVGSGTPRERALVEAMALRYAHTSQARATAPLTAETCGDGKDDKVHPLDAAYADRMRAIADAHPSDPDIASLYAEAEIVATEGEHAWNAQGKPAGRIGPLADRLERMLPAHPEHTGLNHYMVHAVDAVPVANRATVAAERLGRLAPRSAHLVHMPGHIYVHVGRFNEAVRVNEAAVAADLAQAETMKTQGFTNTKDWRGHNQHFLWYAALMAGREKVALDTATEMAQRFARGQSSFAEYVRSLPLITLVRMERWERLLEEAAPAGDKGMAQMWHAYAQGVAQARLGRAEAAQASLQKLQAAATTLRAGHATASRQHKTARAMADTAEAGLQAELAAARRDFTQALARQQAMVKAAAVIDAREPPVLADGTRLGLGGLQGRAGRWADAEATYRIALAERPGSGWALRGLMQALQAQGKRADAEALRREYDRAWSEASPHLKSTARSPS
jgi:tetratricopeptide (TPR) repeat protein